MQLARRMAAPLAIFGVVVCFGAPLGAQTAAKPAAQTSTTQKPAAKPPQTRSSLARAKAARAASAHPRSSLDVACRWDTNK